MGLEESIASEEFDKDAANTPDITRETPAKVKDDFGCPVVSGRNDRRMVFVVKGRRPKIDQADFAIKQDTSLAGISRNRTRGRWDGAVVGKGLVGIFDEKDVFGLQVCMDEVEVVEDCTSQN